MYNILYDIAVKRFDVPNFVCRPTLTPMYLFTISCKECKVSGLNIYRFMIQESRSFVRGCNIIFLSEVVVLRVVMAGSIINASILSAHRAYLEHETNQPPQMEE